MLKNGDVMTKMSNNEVMHLAKQTHMDIIIFKVVLCLSRSDEDN
jgi:hypothetical protein